MPLAVAIRYGHGLWFSTRTPLSSGRVREVGLRRLARPVLLRQHDLAIRPVSRAPPLHVAMQRAELAALVAAGVLLLRRRLEQRLGLELWRRLQPGLRFPASAHRTDPGVRQSRGCFSSDSSLPAATYGLASRGTEP